jgi:hypothetical protein
MLHDQWSMTACGMVVGRPVWLRKRKEKMSGDGFFLFFVFFFFSFFFFFYLFSTPFSLFVFYFIFFLTHRFP